jgi:hypothetical protein
MTPTCVYTFMDGLDVQTDSYALGKTCSKCDDMLDAPEFLARLVIMADSILNYTGKQPTLSGRLCRSCVNQIITALSYCGRRAS